MLGKIVRSEEDLCVKNPSDQLLPELPKNIMHSCAYKES